MAAILKIDLSPYLSRELSDIDQISYADANLPGWLFDKTSKFFKFNTADGRHIENRFLAISWRLIGRSTRNSEKR